MPRRGENIRKRKDGRWEGRYIKGRMPDRTAIWGYIYGHTYTEVKKKMTIRKAEVRACALSEQNPTFQELSHNWEGSISLGVKASTITHYQYTLEHYILPVLGDYRVQELDEYTLERSLLEIITPTDNSHKALGATMARECLVLVRRICRYTIQLHYTIRIVKLKIDTTHILKTATATLIMSAGVLLVKALNVGQMFTIVISVFLGMLLYFSVLVLLKDTFATDAKNFVFQYLSKSSKK